MLFAAGFGTRMRHLTKTQPKPLIKVGGRALIDHTLDHVWPLKPNVVVANAHYLPDMIADHLGGTEVQVVQETPDILDTGGGLRHALPILGPGPIITTNTDAIWTGKNPLLTLCEHWNPERMDALLMCVPVARAIGHAGSGDFTMDENGILTRGAGYVFGGAQIIKTDLLNQIEDNAFSLNVIWDLMQGAGRLFGLEHAGMWCDVGHPEGIALAENMMARNV